MSYLTYEDHLYYVFDYPENLVVYPLFEDKRFKDEDLLTCFEKGLAFKPISPHFIAKDGTLLLSKRGERMRSAYYAALPTCTKCESGKLWRNYSTDVSSYYYECDHCGKQILELVADITGSPFGGFDMICIDLGEVKKEEEPEDAEGSESSDAAMDAVSALATGSQKNATPAPLASGAAHDAPAEEKYSMMLCPKCLKKAALIRDVGYGEEWYCTACTARFYCEKNELGKTFMGLEKTEPGM